MSTPWDPILRERMRIESILESQLFSILEKIDNVSSFITPLKA